MKDDFPLRFASITSRASLAQDGGPRDFYQRFAMAQATQ
jgi:hypothetical protein